MFVVKIDRLIPRLKLEVDYTVDEKAHSAMLTDAGVEKMEKLLNVDNLYEASNIQLVHHVNHALRAHTLYKRNVNYLVEDPACAAVACVFEGMASPERLLRAAEYAWQRDKPLVVYKMATGNEGAAAAMSHTGSLAGSHAAYRAVFQRAGAVLVESYESLVETASFFAKAPPPKAKGAAVVAE